ncbi:ATP-binding cassette sub-family C member 3 [Halotydeus destructor]|nr:ATP-binding cassette sub-family C member 3 [Halotydeus destructor]
MISCYTHVLNCLQSSVARNRLVSFFNGEDDEHAPIRFKEKVEFAISVQNGSYSWSKDGDLKLENVNANFRTGSLTAVIGPVGSGKSSLISAILGDMCRARGIVKINGSIAHIPQTSWIQNATIKKNIMFTSEIEARKYRGIIDACALEDDLKILPAGDETEIGEKGINLSGGQKQRVSLARAVYSDKDIYLLDDTLSAVDANVGNHLFEQVIGPNGLLKNKTRVLVTHKLSVLPFVDNVMIMKDGQVDYQGSYGRLMKERPNYMEFVDKREEAEVEKNDEKTSKQSKEDGQVSRKGRLIKREQLNSNSVMMKVFFQYVKTVNWKRLAYFLFSFAARVGSAVLATLWLAEWAADSENTMRRMDIVLRNIRLTVYSLFGVAQAATSIMLTYGLYTIAADSSKVLHSQMLLRILKAPMSYFDTTPTGRILNRFTSDVYSNDTSLRDSSRTLSLILVAGFNSGILIVLKTPLSLIAIVSVFVLNAWSQNRYLKTSRQLQRIESASRSVVYSQLSETISGSTLIRAYDAVAVFNGNCDTKLNSYNVAAYCRAITRNWMKAVAGSLGALFILSSLGLVLIADLSASTAGIIFGASSAITSAIVQGYEQYATLESCLVAVERCQEFKVTPVEEEDVSCVEPTLGWPQDGSIVFANYSAKYRQELGNVLNNMNLEIAGGEKVGIVGRTGAGKSSILLALFRIIEAAEGNILIDNHDCSKLRLADLRSRMCIIPQDPVLFIGTLRYNLDPFLYHTDDELWTALEIVQLKNFASSLDGGLDHEISEGGENLSVGQRQLVCMARALLRKSKILVLDEATAAIDNDTDDLIQKTIRTEFADCTILTIAHRLNTILDYDKILVMDQGNVAEYDQPNILLKRTGSLFYKLAKDARLI